MNKFYVQLSTLLSLLIGNFLAGLVPLFILGAIASFSCNEHFVYRKNRVVTFLLVCSGGVFMTTCFLILMPQTRKHFEKYEKLHQSTAIDGDNTHEETFPIPELIVMCGFFLTFAIVELLQYILYHFQSKHSKCSDARVRFCSCAKRHTECSRTFKADIPDQTLYGLEKKNSELGLQYSGFNGPSEQATNLTTNLLQSQGTPNYGSVTDERTNTPVNVMTPPPMIADPANVPISQQNSAPNNTHVTSNVLLLIVLSCHALLQGINIGMISSPTWTLLLVLCLQQTILTFVIGNVGLSNNGVQTTALAFIITMSIFSPAGIGLTMIVNDEFQNDLVYFITKGLLCGSLLYFTFCDLLRRPMLKTEPHVSRFVEFTLGAVAVAVLQYVSVIL